MRKLIAATLISGLALIPATSAFADSGTPSAKGADASGTSGDPSGTRLWAVGCAGGHLVGYYIDDRGYIRGHAFPLPCEVDSFYLV